MIRQFVSSICNSTYSINDYIVSYIVSHHTSIYLSLAIWISKEISFSKWGRRKIDAIMKQFKEWQFMILYKCKKFINCRLNFSKQQFIGRWDDYHLSNKKIYHYLSPLSERECYHSVCEQVREQILIWLNNTISLE